METNLLKALSNISKLDKFSLAELYTGKNRINNIGSALEYFIKDVFCSTLEIQDLEKKQEIYKEYFSYLGNPNNPPDFIIKKGDAVEVKKHAGSGTSDLALNSSYPVSVLSSNSPMIARACRDCEKWDEKDLIYTIGNVMDDHIGSLWFVYGDCYAAERGTYEKIKNEITKGINDLPDIEFGETSELGRVNKVDPLGITNLRIRGMWSIKHPQKVFEYCLDNLGGNKYMVNAILLSSKYDSFPEEDRINLESLVSDKLIINEIQIKSPNNPAQSLNAKLISIIKL